MWHQSPKKYSKCFGFGEPPQEEQKETSSKSSDSKREQEVNSGTGNFETETSGAKPKKQDMDDTAEMSNDEIESSEKNEAGNFKTEATGTSNFETEPTGTGNFETKTSGTSNFHQDGNRTGDKGEGGGLDKDEKGNARPKKQVKEDTGKTTKDEGVGCGEMFEDKEEANQFVISFKRPIGKDKEGKKENNERPKTEPGRVARDRNKVQEPRDKRDKDNIQDGPEGDDQHKDGGSKHFDRTRLAKNTTGPATLTEDDYLLADPRLAEAHNSSTVVPGTRADCSVQHNIPGTNLPRSKDLSKEGDGKHEGKGVGEGIGYDAGADHQTDQHKEGGSEPFDKARLAKIAAGHTTPTGDYYLLADPRLVEAHDSSTVLPRTGADRSLQHNIPGTNRP